MADDDRQPGWRRFENFEGVSQAEEQEARIRSWKLGEKFASRGQVKRTFAVTDPGGIWGISGHRPGR